MTPSPLTMPHFAEDPTALIVFGGGGQGRTVIDLVRTIGAHRLAGVVDDGLPAGSEVLGVPVLGGAEALAEWRRKGVCLAVNAVGGIGNVAVRVKVYEILARAGFACPTLVHPSTVIEASAVLAGGVQILAQSYIGSAARIGYGTLINAGVIVSHDCNLGQCVNLSPGAALAGGVIVEDFAQIGMNATVNIGVRIGSMAQVGNGATVKADVPAGTLVRAVTIWPARATSETGSF
ncbi:MAG TPA: acetyltransferase [Anaerolineaceae bacterium]|nr:acetyltransferase [Anaerolineaceae bacterium]